VAFLGEKAEVLNDRCCDMRFAVEEQSPPAWKMRDTPEVLHDRSGNLSFADGHVESRRWQDTRTINAPRNDAVMAGNQDLLWLQQRATWREPLSSTNR